MVCSRVDICRSLRNIPVVSGNRAVSRQALAGVQTGMQLVALGSGGAFTPRAAARVGHLLLNRGAWEGHQLVTSESVDQLTRAYGSGNREPADPGPSSAMGWWVNANGFFEALPRDALIAGGGGHQLVMVVPSEQLVAVRVGRDAFDS